MESFQDSRNADWYLRIQCREPTFRSCALLHLLQHFDAERIQTLLQYAGGHVAEREAGGAVVFPIATRLHPSAQGCDAGATLGQRHHRETTLKELNPNPSI